MSLGKTNTLTHNCRVCVTLTKIRNNELCVDSQECISVIIVIIIIIIVAAVVVLRLLSEWIDRSTPYPPQGRAWWVFRSAGGLPTAEIGADSESRWKSQVDFL